jgi:hypothetical protein
MRRPGRLTAGLRGISQEILADYSSLRRALKGHQELLMPLRQGHILRTNTLHTGPGSDRRCQRLPLAETLRETTEDTVFEGRAVLRRDPHPAYIVHIGLEKDGS